MIAHACRIAINCRQSQVVRRNGRKFSHNVVVVVSAAALPAVQPNEKCVVCAFAIECPPLEVSVEMIVFVVRYMLKNKWK